ncbi:MAG: DUF262 domain-containing protein [Anaerolineae bacterium]
MAQGAYRIPRFQRSFVWERSRIQSLLDSMYQEYPIGTVFLWKAPSKFNHMLRSVEYLMQPPIELDQSYTFILDGQQRLTSLYVTINGLEIDGEDYSKIVADMENDEPNKHFQYRNADNRRWIAIRDLLKESVFDVYDTLPSEYRQRFQDIRQRLISYPFSVVSVSNMDLEDAIEIFERINQQSKRLTRYDLIAASVLTDEFDLRERSQTDIIEPLEKSFGGIQETNVPQALALNIKGGTEHTTQMGLESIDVQNAWARTVECIKLAVDFFQANLGVKRSDFIPYSAMLPVLAYYFYYGETNGIKSNFHRDQLEMWFWRTAFAERYSGASQTRMSEDAERIRRLLDHNEPFDFDTMPVPLDEKSLVQASMRNTTSAIRNGVLCMLNLKRPLHFVNHSEILIQGDHFSKFTSAERHHIFPIAFLLGQNVPRNQIHSIPNFCFIPAELNQEISDMAPSEYFGKLFELHGDNGDFKKILDTHFIPSDENSGIWNNDFTTFLNQRARLMVDEIRTLCGLKVRMIEEQRNPVIDAVEIAIRDKIHEVLNAAFGLEYWRKAIPNDVQNRVSERIDKIVSNIPGSERAHYNDLRSRLDQCDVADYSKIIISNQNWNHFSPHFRSKSDCERMLNDFRIFRNSVKHSQSVDSLLDLRGQAAILWLSRAIKLDLSHFGIE